MSCIIIIINKKVCSVMSSTPPRSMSVYVYALALLVFMVLIFLSYRYAFSGLAYVSYARLVANVPDTKLKSKLGLIAETPPAGRASGNIIVVGETSIMKFYPHTASALSDVKKSISIPASVADLFPRTIQVGVTMLYGRELYFMIQDLTPGAPLANTSLSAAEKPIVCELLCKALMRMENADYCHRDLHPENIFVVRDANGAVSRVGFIDVDMSTRASGDCTRFPMEIPKVLVSFVKANSTRSDMLVIFQWHIWSSFGMPSLNVDHKFAFIAIAALLGINYLPMSNAAAQLPNFMSKPHVTSPEQIFITFANGLPGAISGLFHVLVPSLVKDIHIEHDDPSTLIMLLCTLTLMTPSRDFGIAMMAEGPDGGDGSIELQISHADTILKSRFITLRSIYNKIVVSVTTSNDAISVNFVTPIQITSAVVPGVITLTGLNVASGMLVLEGSYNSTLSGVIQLSSFMPAINTSNPAPLPTLTQMQRQWLNALSHIDDNLLAGIVAAGGRHKNTLRVSNAVWHWQTDSGKLRVWRGENHTLDDAEQKSFMVDNVVLDFQKRTGAR